MSAKLVVHHCPNCDAELAEIGACPYCGATVHLEPPEAKAQGAVTSPSQKEAQVVIGSVQHGAAPPWVAEAQQLIANGRKIAAIRLARWHTGGGLKECKDLVESGDLDDPSKAAGLPENKDPLPELDRTESCFSGDTRVSTPRGLIKIAELHRGDVIWGWDERSRRRCLERVRAVRVHLPARLWRVTVSSGAGPLSITRNHTLLTRRGWLRVDQLRPGDLLLAQLTQAPGQVLDVRPTPRFATVYNLVATGSCTYIADGWIAHSFTRLRGLRTLVHRLLPPVKLPRNPGELFGSPAPHAPSG